MKAPVFLAIEVQSFVSASSTCTIFQALFQNSHIFSSHLSFLLLQVFGFDDLPDDVIVSIAAVLDVKEIFTWRLVCKSMDKRLRPLLADIPLELHPPINITGGKLAKLCNVFPNAASVVLTRCHHPSMHDDILLNLPAKLKTLDLTDCDDWVDSDTIVLIASMCRSLETLKFAGCSCVSPWLPSAIVQLDKLRVLSVNCVFESPEDLCKLTNLVDLELDHNETSFQELPEGISALQALTRLALLDCFEFWSLHGIEGLRALKVLHVDNAALAVIPEGIGQLSLLQHLCLEACKIETLPESISALQSLHTLDLSYCGLLRSLPDGVRSLGNLTNLDLMSCESLVSLPEGISDLGLKRLALAGSGIATITWGGCDIRIS